MSPNGSSAGFFFSVVIALLPIIYRTIKNSTELSWSNFEASIAHGELSLITAALCAAAIGDVMGTGRTLRFTKLICSAASISILTLAAFHFGDVALVRSITSIATPPQSEAIVHQSLMLFGWSIPACAGCVVIAEIDRGI